MIKIIKLALSATLIAIVFRANSAIPEKILGRFADGTIQELSLPNECNSVRIYSEPFASHGECVEIIQGEATFIDTVLTISNGRAQWCVMSCIRNSFSPNAPSQSTLDKIAFGLPQDRLRSKRLLSFFGGGLPGLPNVEDMVEAGKAFLHTAGRLLQDRYIREGEGIAYEQLGLYVTATLIDADTLGLSTYFKDRLLITCRHILPEYLSSEIPQTLTSDEHGFFRYVANCKDTHLKLTLEINQAKIPAIHVVTTAPDTDIALIVLSQPVYEAKPIKICPIAAIDPSGIVDTYSFALDAGFHMPCPKPVFKDAIEDLPGLPRARLLEIQESDYVALRKLQFGYDLKKIPLELSAKSGPIIESLINTANFVPIPFELGGLNAPCKGSSGAAVLNTGGECIGVISTCSYACGIKAEYLDTLVQMVCSLLVD
ncbi:MAG: hypothetical protein LBL30_00155 [Holosporales bacterium]|nr:hypothetical protein [Holosporales bacterium]